MNVELQQDIGIAAVTFLVYAIKGMGSLISVIVHIIDIFAFLGGLVGGFIAGIASLIGYFEYWLNTETELLAILQDVFVKHKNKHTFEEMILFSLLMGMAVKDTMDDLHKLDKENEE